MKRIIILRGRPASGKSTIINLLIDWLLGFENQNTIREEEWGEANGVIDRYGEININGLRIGLISAGDLVNHTQKRLEERHRANCDIIICSCHWRMSTHNSVREFLNNQNETERQYIERFIEVWPRANDEQNERILSELQTLLTGVPTSSLSNSQNKLKFSTKSDRKIPTLPLYDGIYRGHTNIA